MKILIKIILVMIVSLLLCMESYADTCEEASGYTCNEIVDAIYVAEGGNSTKYPFGIMSVKCDGYAECRQVCLNTVRNNVKRWKVAVTEGDNRDYLTFLWHRYCPPTEHSLNKHWKKNVEQVLRRK